jgi:hypothetical protein
LIAILKIREKTPKNVVEKPNFQKIPTKQNILKAPFKNLPKDEKPPFK